MGALGPELIHYVIILLRLTLTLACTSQLSSVLTSKALARVKTAYLYTVQRVFFATMKFSPVASIGKYFNPQIFPVYNY